MISGLVKVVWHAAMGALLLILMSGALCAASGPEADPFGAGSARLSIHFGNAIAFNRDYSIFGIGGGYYVADGVEVGIDMETWSGNTPHIQQVSPQVRLVMDGIGPVRPYGGLFYQRTTIEGYRGTDTVGARLGAYILTHRSAYFGIGLAGASHVNCDRSVYSSCTEAYPELLFAVTF
jgi:hypothetical protein